KPQRLGNPRQSARRAAVPLEVAAPPGAHRRAARGNERGDGRCLFPFAPSGFSARLGGFGPVAPARFARDLSGARRRAPRPLPARRGRAAAALDGLPPRARADRVLARPRSSPARTPPVHPSRGRVDEHAALSMSSDASSRAFLTRSAAFASIATALLLAGLKGWAVWRTSSTAMLGSLADTALDLVASLATLVGVWIAAQPADEDHRFGHGKAEALAAMIQVILIVLSAGGIAFRAALRLVEGGRVEAADDGILVSGIAILATLALLAWQRHVIRRTGSLAIRTDNIHYQSDLFLNLAVIAALALDQYLGLRQADPLFGLGIA